MEPLTIALVVLVVVGIWAVVELALVLRRTRKSVGELTESVNGTLDELRPVITKLDGAADELVPASKRIEPILEKAATSVDLINVDLVRVESILSDVGTVTDTSARASNAVSGAVDAVASGVAGAVGRVAGKVGAKQQAKLEEAAKRERLEAAPAEKAAAEQPVEQVSGDAGYFTYPVDAEGGAVPSADASAEATGDGASE